MSGESFDLNTENDGPEIDRPSQTDDGAALEESLQGILFEVSPYQNVNAIVQHDGRAVYFYLSGNDSFGTKACWIRNLIEAPYVISQQDLDAGLPPLMPRTHCRQTAGLPLPDPEKLEVVWFEEGNGAALFESSELIAVIPPWSGVDGFHGYSIECVAESPIAWPMLENPAMRKRIERAKEFWQLCASEDHHPFATLQPKLLEVYRACYHDKEQYFTLDGGQFPPRGAVLYRSSRETTLISVGMSFRPQPNVEMSVEHPRELRRIELAISLPSHISETLLVPVLEEFSGLVAWPWNGYTWFGQGHSCEMHSLKAIYGESTWVVKLTGDKEIEPAFLRMPAFRDDPINVLWLSPSSEKENADN